MFDISMTLGLLGVCLLVLAVLYRQETIFGDYRCTADKLEDENLELQTENQYWHGQYELQLGVNKELVQINSDLINKNSEFARENKKLDKDNEELVRELHQSKKAPVKQPKEVKYVPIEKSCKNCGRVWDRQTLITDHEGNKTVATVFRCEFEVAKDDNGEIEPLENHKPCEKWDFSEYRHKKFVGELKPVEFGNKACCAPESVQGNSYGHGCGTHGVGANVDVRA